MNKDLIKKKYYKKIELIDHYNEILPRKYFKIPDSSSMNKKKIIDLENKYSFLRSELSPQKKVGYKPSKFLKK